MYPTLHCVGGQVSRFELGDETLETGVELERQKQVEHLHRSETRRKRISTERRVHHASVCVGRTNSP